MGRINSQGSWFEKILSGWVFGTQLHKLIFKGNAEIQGRTSGPQYTHILQDKDGILAHLDDLGDAGIPDAPIDGSLYGRKDADWEVIPLFDPADYDLEQFNNAGADPFAYQSQIPYVPNELDEFGNSGVDPYVRNSELPYVPTDLEEFTNNSPNNPYLRLYDRPHPLFKLYATNTDVDPGDLSLSGKNLVYNRTNINLNTGLLTAGNSMYLPDLSIKSPFTQGHGQLWGTISINAYSNISSSKLRYSVDIFRKDITGVETSVGSYIQIETDFFSIGSPAFNKQSYFNIPESTFGVTDSIVFRILVTAVDINSNASIRLGDENFGGINFFNPFNDWKYKKIIDDAPVQADIDDLQVQIDALDFNLGDIVSREMIENGLAWFLPALNGITGDARNSARVNTNPVYFGTVSVGALQFSITAHSINGAGQISGVRSHTGFSLSPRNGIDTVRDFYPPPLPASSDVRYTVGWSQQFNAADPTNTDQLTHINCMYLCKLATSDNLHIVHNDNTGTATSIDLGVNFPANSTLYKYRFFVRKTTNSDYTVQAIRTTLLTGAILASTVYNITTDLPNLAADLNQIFYISSNTQTGFYVFGDYGLMVKRTPI
jgi:hypothetical protein